MSDYTVTTNFGAKDSLPSSNPAKVVRGSEFTTEFTNIQTAVATKADTAGDTFTGVVNFSNDIAVNTNTLFVDVSTAKVGIGTASPAYELDVTGSAQLTGGDLILRGDSTNADTQSIRFENVANDDRSAYIRADYEANSSGNGIGLAFGTNDSGQDGQTRMVLTRIGKVGIGTTSPSTDLHIKNTSAAQLLIESGETATGFLLFGDASDLNIGSVSYDHSDNSMRFETDDTERMRINSAGNVGIGETDPDTELHISAAFPKILMQDTDGTNQYGEFYHSNGTTAISARDNTTNGSISFQRYDGTTATTSMRIDTSGNLLVGTTVTNSTAVSSGGTTTGVEFQPSGELQIGSDGDKCAIFNRQSSDGEILRFRRDGATVGSIGTETGRLTIGSGDTGLRLLGDTDEITPWNTSTNAGRDALIDLGNANNRFKDIYRSGSTYSTSDRNKKQDIRDLTDAEARVATVAKGSLKAFRYIDSVEAEGDEANIHFGIIAQDLKAAFEAEGLNADSYQVLKTSTYTDDDGVEQTTYSVCYENLLAFIISAI